MIKDKCFYTVTLKAPFHNMPLVIRGKANKRNDVLFETNGHYIFKFMIKHIEPVFDELDEDGYI